MHDLDAQVYWLGPQERSGQCASSELSPQSSSLSHTQRLWTQRPLAHVNSSGRQVSSAKERVRLVTTATDRKALYAVFTVICLKLEVYLLQAFSSLASLQSGWLSHIHVRGTHSPSPERQVNCSGEQVFWPVAQSKRGHVSETYDLQSFATKITSIWELQPFRMNVGGFKMMKNSKTLVKC